ncbi:MAG: sulfurtransferase [Chloroflexota bacterium]
MFTTIISTQNLEKHLNDPNWVIVDCSYDLKEKEKGRERYLVSHIPGAVFVHVYRNLSGPPLTDKGRHPLPSPKALSDLFSKIGVSANTQVVAYDDSAGAYAARLWWSLNYMGHQKVAVLDGGFSAWVAEGRATSAGDEFNDPVDFQGSPQKDRLVVLDEVLERPLLIDSRDSDRYFGLAKGSDPVAGHIPGAAHYHYVQSLTGEKKLKPSDELKTTFEELLGDTPPEEVTFYCGSGISACVSLLAMTHAGLPMGKLYVGSWSEWSREKEG